MELKFDAITDSLSEQEWVQQLKVKWEEMDPQSRAYLKMTGLAALLLGLLYLILSTMWHVHSLKSELSEKSELLMTIQGANEEMRRLHEAGTPQVTDQAGPWNTYFEGITTNAGMDKSIVSISPEKPTGSGDTVKESLFDLTFKKATIRQVVKFAWFLENGARPVKIRNLSIDTNADPSGYLEATLSISAFSITESKESKEGKSPR